jgi:hypothetical protein
MKQTSRKSIVFGWGLAILGAGGFALQIEGVEASALSDLVATMQPGQWRELMTNNINPTLSAGGASGIVFGYTESARWDPVSRQLFFAGGDHNDLAQFISYKESNNTWQRLPRPGWMPSSTMHGYDHSAVDPAGRYFYHRPYNSTTIQRYHIDNQSWSAIAALPGSVMGYNNCCVGVDWFPELGALVYASSENGPLGSLAKWTASNNTWTRVTQPTLTIGGYHSFAEYNPVHKLVLFGGGNDPGSRNIYKVDASGQVTALNQAPVKLAIQDSIVTVDPLGGDYLVFTTARQFYVYRVQNDSWSLQNGGTSLPIWTTNFGNPVHGVVATPLSNFGVTLFVTCNGSNACKVHLYKHAPGTVDTTKPAAPSSLSASG